MKRGVYFLALLFLSSCVATDEASNEYDVINARLRKQLLRSTEQRALEQETLERTTRSTRVVRVETIPSKRKIMLNNEYIGDSPIAVELTVFDKEYRSSRIKIRYTVEAYPERGDAQSQIKIIELSECDECGEKKPFRVLMDMSLKYVK